MDQFIWNWIGPLLAHKWLGAVRQEMAAVHIPVTDWYRWRTVTRRSHYWPITVMFAGSLAQNLTDNCAMRVGEYMMRTAGYYTFSQQNEFWPMWKFVFFFSRRSCWGTQKTISILMQLIRATFRSLFLENICSRLLAAKSLWCRDCRHVASITYWMALVLISLTLWPRYEHKYNISATSFLDCYNFEWWALT